MRTLNEAMSNPNALDGWHNYAGEQPYDDWFMVAGRSRDSRILEESNFHCILKALGGESDDVVVYCVGHWAVGWIEEILINPQRSDLVVLGNKIHKELDAYPVYDEADFSEREQNERERCWKSLSISERVELCQKFGLSIFTARYNYPPSNGGDLDDWLTIE